MKKFILSLAIATGISANAQNFEYWGLTQQSGANGKGSIYKTDSIGENNTLIHSFNDGEKPSGSLYQASNGILYGATSFGGLNDLGVIFSIDPVTETFSKISDFTSTTGGRPRGGFMQASNGMLYITTFEAGANSRGTIVELNPSNNSTTVRHDFGASSNDPSKPLAGEMIEVGTGKLYGATRYGGQYAKGTLYEYDLSTYVVTKLHDFNDAAEPFNSLVSTSIGLIYGTTFKGGPTDDGSIFAYDIAQDTFSIEMYFTDTSSIGRKPQGSLIEATDGRLYGVTSANGHLFSYEMVTRKYNGLGNVSDARGTLLQASNGRIYGTTYTGSVFQYEIGATNFTGQSSAGVYTLYGKLIEIEGNPVSVNELETKSEVNVYPNPATDVIKLSINSQLVNIYNVAGQLVLSSSDNKINVATLKAGQYIVIALTKNGVVHSKFIKQ